MCLFYIPKKKTNWSHCTLRSRNMTLVKSKTEPFHPTKNQKNHESRVRVSATNKFRDVKRFRWDLSSDLPQYISNFAMAWQHWIKTHLNINLSCNKISQHGALMEAPSPPISFGSFLLETFHTFASRELKGLHSFLFPPRYKSSSWCSSHCRFNMFVS